MKRNSLGWWLAASNVAIVLLVAAGISYFAIDMLRGLADSQQKVRVQLAGANARQEITRMAEDTLTYARVLAERPPLQPPARPNPGARAWRLSCAASARPPNSMPARYSTARRWWPRAARRCRGRSSSPVAQEQGERFMAVPAGTQFSVVGAVGQTTGAVHLVQRHGRAPARRCGSRSVLSEHSGLPVRLINYRAFNALPDNEFTSLHSQAMTDGRFAVQRIDSLGLYASSFPMFSSSGEGIALIETARLGHGNRSSR